MLLEDPRVHATVADDEGCTPLWVATCFGRQEVVEWLVASGRDLGDIDLAKGSWKTQKGNGMAKKPQPLKSLDSNRERPFPCRLSPDKISRHRNLPAIPRNTRNISK